MRIEEEVKLDFCDVLIRPKRSESKSRSEIDLVRKFKFKNSGNGWQGVPIMASNMDTVGTFAMANSLSGFQMQTCLHKHYEISKLVDFFNNASGQTINHTFYTLGILENDFLKFNQVYEESNGNIVNVCIDVANGYSAFFVERVAKFRQQYPSLNIMAGNVATPEMVQELIFNGADIVKLGIGPGSMCVTRKVAGVGYPQLSAVMECADAAHGLSGHVCSDGGIQMYGDIAKAIGAGSDFVMMGGMFGGCDECEGEWKKLNGNKYLKAYGMASKEAMDKYNVDPTKHRTPEGKQALIKHKGPVSEMALDICGGLRSACSYVGAMSLKDLSKCTTFVKVNRTHNQIFGE
jgi:GMP reductase